MFNDLMALYRVVAIATVGHQAATILWRHVRTFTSLDMETVSLLANILYIYHWFYSDYKQALADFILVGSTSDTISYTCCRV